MATKKEAIPALAINTSVFDGLQREFQDEELQIEDGDADGDKEA